MMGFLLLLPFLMLRFGLLALLNKEAVKRAAHFPPLRKTEKIWYWVYQISALAMYVFPFFLKIHIVPLAWCITGIAVYSTGAILLTIALINFAAPSESGVTQSGLYRLSRNPLYVAYFVFFLGCALLTQSLMLLSIVLVLQISTHRVILAEERWCAEQFGEAYLHYVNRVRRYI